MKSKLLLFFLLISSVIVNAQPANDNCENAQEITVTTSFQVVAFDLMTATVNNESACSGDSLDDYVDVWYQFVMPTAGKLSINGSVAINGFNIYDSCNGTELICFSTSNLVEGLVEGNNYTLRVRRRTSQNTPNFQEFYIYALEPLANDTCANSENIVVDSSLQTINFNIVEANTNNEIGCEGESLQVYKDIWYNFTMPVNGSLEISSGTSINRFALYDGCNGTQIACFSDSDFYASYIDGLIQGQNYTLRIFRSNLNNPNSQSFTIRAIEPTFPSCQNTESLTVSTTSQTIELDLDNAIYFYEYGCEAVADSYADFWYEFTMPAVSNLYLNMTSYLDAAIYDGCNGNLLDCFNENKVLDDLVSGETYFLRVFRSQSTSPSFGDHFSLRTYNQITNVDCSSAEVLPILTANNTAIYFELAGAQFDTQETCSGNSDYIADAWWQMTMPITGNLFIDTPGGNGIAVYDACNGNELFCNASEGSLDSFKLIDNLIEGNTYLIRFFNTETSLFESEFQTMNLRVYERAENDACANAESIPTITDSAQEISFYTLGSEINEEFGCGTFNLEDYVDVWFEFTMPNLPGNLTITSYIYNYYAVFDACNGNEIYCFQGSDQVEGLIPGETYILRAFQRQNEMFHPYAYFDIWVDGTLDIPMEEINSVSMNFFGKNTLQIQNLNDQASLEIFNIMGQKVISKTLNPSYSQTMEINEPTGIYFAKLYSDIGTATLKMLVRN